MVSKDDIRKMSNFSMLKFNDEEMEKLEAKLNESLNRVKILEEVDTENIENLYQINDDIEEFRKDQLEEEYVLSREEALKNAKEKQYGYFKLLNIMD